MMEEEPAEWFRRAAAVQPLGEAADRYVSIPGGSGSAGLAALDEIVAAGDYAHQWLEDNPTSLDDLRILLQRYIAAYVGIADEARAAGSDPERDGDASKARMGALADEIRVVHESLRTWEQ
jgi:hypothetical protein